MASILYKWLFLSLLVPFQIIGITQATHPYFLSVVEVEHSATNKTLEISCKLFTDDFEKTLRMHYKSEVDLINPKDKAYANKIISEYVQQHFTITADGKSATMNFVGYEKEDEGIISYFQVNNIASLKKIAITDNLLYEYKKEQMSIIHVIVGGVRKSNRLTNPEEKISVEF